MPPPHRDPCPPDNDDLGKPAHPFRSIGSWPSWEGRWRLDGVFSNADCRHRFRIYAGRGMWSCARAPKRAPPLFVPPAGHSLHLCRGDLRFRADDWSSTAALKSPGPPGRVDNRDLSDLYLRLRRRLLGKEVSCWFRTLGVEDYGDQGFQSSGGIMPEVRTFSHVASTVTNLEVSAFWYEALLGAQRATTGSDDGHSYAVLVAPNGSSSDCTTIPQLITKASSARCEWGSTTFRLLLPIERSLRNGENTWRGLG
jgi:hypothetical protein